MEFQNAKGPTSDSNESPEGEEQDEPSSSSGIADDDLTIFRENWKKEIKESPKHQSNATSTSHCKEKEPALDAETLAKKMFLKGAEMERQGEMYEAIQFYRRAVQLVPDIEFRMDEKVKIKGTEGEVPDEEPYYRNHYEGNSDSSSDDGNSDEEIGINLIAHIQKKLNKQEYFCTPQFPPNGLHISNLPPEIILYILRWVVSSELDFRSLEMCSRVSRGFYLCCRDSEIWKSACFKVWGANCGDLCNKFFSWREMFIERTHLNYNGCYISKTSYLRHGENSFQDQFYRPWHIVTYYRYLRFFPEGLVLMLTSSDEPNQCVNQLKHRKPRVPAVLSGHYILKEDKVILAVQRRESAKTAALYKRNRKRDNLPDTAEQSFHLEMQINNYKNQKHIKLVWTGYSIYTRNRSGTENTSFEVVGNRFPPLWFSRVKSYTSESPSPLQ